MQRTILAEDERCVAEDAEFESRVIRRGGEKMGLGLPESLGRVVRGDGETVEMVHELRGGVVRDGPQGNDDFADSGQRESPAQAQNAFPRNWGAGTGFARGKSDEPGSLKRQGGDFPRKQEVVVCGILVGIWAA